MPINPELKHLYPADWAEISHRIRFQRAGGKCERCGVPHGHFRDEFEAVHDPKTWASLQAQGFIWRATRIILTTAHLDHDPTNNDEQNLAALCQRCHLRHDLAHHLMSRRLNREKANNQQRLFER